MYGYWGKLLRVNLTSRACRIDDIPEETFSLLIGGSALGAKILLEETPAKVDPLSPENSSSLPWVPSRGEVSRQRQMERHHQGAPHGNLPRVGGYGPLGALFQAVRLRCRGVRGRADSPVYVFIKDGGAEIRDAAFLWGKDTIETGELIKEDLGDRRINALNIGPAGENAPIACISCDGHSLPDAEGRGPSWARRTSRPWRHGERRKSPCMIRRRRRSSRRKRSRCSTARGRSSGSRNAPGHRSPPKGSATLPSSTGGGTRTSGEQPSSALPATRST